MQNNCNGLSLDWAPAAVCHCHKHFQCFFFNLVCLTCVALYCYSSGDNSPWVCHISTLLTSTLVNSTWLHGSQRSFQGCLYSQDRAKADLCTVQYTVFLQGQGLISSLPIRKDLGFLSSGFPSCKVTYSMHRCHLASFDCLVELWLRKTAQLLTLWIQ